MGKTLISFYLDNTLLNIIDDYVFHEKKNKPKRKYTRTKFFHEASEFLLKQKLGFSYLSKKRKFDEKV